MKSLTHMTFPRSRDIIGTLFNKNYALNILNFYWNCNCSKFTFKVSYSGSLTFNSSHRVEIRFYSEIAQLASLHKFIKLVGRIKTNIKNFGHANDCNVIDVFNDVEEFTSLLPLIWLIISMIGLITDAQLYFNIPTHAEFN